MVCFSNEVRLGRGGGELDLYSRVWSDAAKGLCTFRAKSRLGQALFKILNAQEHDQGTPVCEFIRDIPSALEEAPGSTLAYFKS